MRIDFATQPLAQTFANAVHARMIAGAPAYARSVSTGQTARWAIPYNDAGAWWVNLKVRVNGVITAQERLLIKPYA